MPGDSPGAEGSSPSQAPQAADAAAQADQAPLSTASVTSAGGHGHGPLSKAAFFGLALGSVGVVFGDIGTSPLYAMREALHHTRGGASELAVLGVVSLVFWALVLIVTVKYVVFLMRADNKGEGGTLALMALAQHALPKRSGIVFLLGVCGAALFYGDGVITPAVSVLSAIEGVKDAPGVGKSFDNFVLPITAGILIALFAVQSKGTASVARFFGPITALWFLTLAVLGLIHIGDDVSVFRALSPHYGVQFLFENELVGFIILGSVFLAVTGAEALYADMGHFGKGPIRAAWAVLVLPCLTLNYLGQGAMVLAHPETAENPFFRMIPEVAYWPVLVLATVATVIASQAVISGAFSVTQQAIQLGFIPRLRITHTSEHAAGQIYIPIVNWVLMIMVILLVLMFGSSSNLAAAYGIAVTGAMLIDGVLISVLLFSLWKWPRWKALPLLFIFFTIDILYFGANLLKVPDGGWFPLLIGAIAFTMLTTWAKGRKLMIDRMAEAALPIEVFIKSAATSATRVAGTAVFMTTSMTGVPHALLHNLKHNKVLHERVMLLTVRIEDVPFVIGERRIETKDYGAGFYRIIIRYGFMEEIDVPAALAMIKTCGPQFKMMDTSFFLARQTLIASARPGMAIWREKLFAWMLRNAESAMEFFKLPTNRVVELGSQVEI